MKQGDRNQYYSKSHEITNTIRNRIGIAFGTNNLFTIPRGKP